MFRIDDYGPASAIPDPEIGRAVARQLVSSFDTELPNGRAGDAVVLARAVGITVLAIEQMSGWARQTVYRHQKAVGDPRLIGRAQARFEAMVVLAAGGPATVTELAQGLALTPEVVLPAMFDLASDELCFVENIGDDRRAEPTPGTYLELRRYFNRHVDREPDAYIVCLELDARMDPAMIQKAADAVLSSTEAATVASPDLIPSRMRGHELLLPVRAPTQSRALAFAFRVWPAILSEAKVAVSEPRLVDVIPPGLALVVASQVLDRFVEVLHENGVGTPGVLRSLRASYSGSLGEKMLSVRCLTEAAIALRRAAGQERNPLLLATGDDAFDEWMPAHSLRLTGELEKVQRPAVAALELAMNRMGPYRGGEIGSMKEPGGRPAEPVEVSPTSADLVGIAGLAAEAVSAAALQGLVSADDVAERVIDPAYST